jgi:TolB protein
MEEKLQELYNSVSPDPDFARRLRNQIVVRARRPQPARRLRPLLPSLAWGSAILLLILALVWGINNLIPQPTPVTGYGVESIPQISLTPSSVMIDEPVQLPKREIASQSRRDGDDEIYRMLMDGSEVINLTNHPGSDTSPAWSPDGRWIAFLSDRTGKAEVFLMDASGGDLRQLTDSPANTWYAPMAWSPDGTRLALAGGLDGADENHANLYLVSTDGSGFEQLLIVPYSFYPKWSPVGRQIVFRGLQEGQFGLFIIDADGSGLFKIPFEASDEGQFGVLSGSFDWSPDGSRLVYQQTGPLTGSWPDLSFTPRARADLIMTRADGSDPQTIHTVDPLPNGIRFASWSPDGSTILFIRAFGRSACFRINLIPLDTLEVREVEAICYTPRTLEPDWTQDGEWLVFTADLDGSGQHASLYALHVSSAIQNPAEPVLRKMTEANGMDLNPQVRPLVSGAPTPTPPAITEMPENAIFYTVQEGDTLESIATQEGLPLDQLRALNDYYLAHVDFAPGVELLLGFDGQRAVFYPVNQGDSLYGIAERLGARVETLVTLNRIPELVDNEVQQMLYPGLQLIIGLEDDPHPSLTSLPTNLFLSTLAFKQVNSPESSDPDFFIADVYADGYLLGRVDFGTWSGNYCDRSWNGGVIAFLYDKLDPSRNANPILRWFSLEDVTRVYDPLPDFSLQSLASFAPGDYRLAFEACPSDGNCGLYIYDLATGVARKISGENTWHSPVWSPDGTQIAIQLPPDEERGNLNSIHIIRAEDGVVLYTGRADAPDSPLRDWGEVSPFEIQGMERCEGPTPTPP